MERVRKPNVILVITDDQGYGDLGCTGNSVIQTPHIDQFYRESVRFTDFHVGPTCAPTRSGLFTGHYANSTGVWHTIGGRSLLRKNEWTIANAFGEAGYQTALFGKWHLGDNAPFRPQDRGFQVTVTHGGGGISQTPDYWGNDYFDDVYSVNGEYKAFEGYCTDVFFREAVRFIDTCREQPFFCCIATNAPHSPYNVEDRYADLYRGSEPEDRARFYGMITCIDDNFGRLRDKLKELDLEENTILVFMTDNGTSCGARFNKQGFLESGYNAGLRGTKGSPYDGGHRVPFFIRCPALGIEGGRDVERLAANIDYMPTMLDLCGVPVPSERSFHGISLKPLLMREPGAWEPRILVTDSQRIAYPEKWRQSAVMNERWRLINGAELYDMVADREQRRNVADLHPLVVEQFRDAYELWWELVSVRFDETIPIELGGPDSQAVTLTTHDWRNEKCETAWHQGLVRKGLSANGYYETDVRSAGLYRFELHRWPREADRALSDGMEGEELVWRKDAIGSKDWEWYSGGCAFSFKEARLQIGDLLYSQPIEPEAQQAVFTVELEEGETWITATLDDGEREMGAYYVYVSKLI
jgi:arylsulfatase A-like enzyme